ncbi:hypothetical protein GEMRC1_012777 [Eukaryota sp. GEM-RC1]
MCSRIQSFASLLSSTSVPETMPGMSYMFEESAAEIERCILSQLTIRNVTASFDLKCAVVLKDLTDRLPDANCDPRFPGAVDVQLNRPKVVAKISNSGKVNIVGAQTEADCIAAMRRVVKLLRRLNVPCSAQPSDFRVYQTMATSKLEKKIDVDQIQLDHWECCDRDDLHFMRISYKFVTPRVTVQIYGSGSFVFIGTNADAIRKAVTEISRVLEGQLSERDT